MAEDDIELLRLRARAKQKAEQEMMAQEAAIPAEVAQPEGPGVTDFVTGLMNWPGGLVRGSIAGAVEPFVGKDLVSLKEVGYGTVPGTSELLGRAGVPEGYSLSNLIPKMYSETGEGLPLQKGGMFDPTARGVAGLAGDIGLDPATYLAAPLKAVQVAGKAGPKALAAAKFGEVVFNPVGEAIGAGATALKKGGQLAGKVGTAIAGKLSQFTPSEAEQYLRNPQAVKQATEMLSDKTNLDVAQEMAFNAISKMKDTIRKAGMNADKQMSELLEGKNVELNINAIKSMAKELPPKAEAEVSSIIAQIEKDTLANRPFQPEFLSRTSVQPGVEGLTYPATSATMETPTIRQLVEEQPSLFDVEKVLKPQPEFLMTPQTTMQIPGKVIPGKPAYSEFFPQEVGKFSEMLQEPLELPARSMLPEKAVTPATVARRLKQIFQKEAKYAKSSPVTAKGMPRDEDYAAIADAINAELRKQEGVKSLDDFMRQGVVLQQELEKGANAPLQFLKTQSEDITATLSRAAKRTGDKEVFDLANQLSAARKIMGKGDYDDWVSRAGIRKVGRGALQAMDKFSRTGKATEDMINAAIKDKNVPPQIWMEMIRAQNKESEK